MSDKEDVDISSILRAIDNSNNENIMKYTRESISSTRNDILQRLHLPVQTLKDYNNKLKNYRYIEDLSDMNYGSYIRWINIRDPSKIKLTNGGIVCDVKFTNTGVNVVCKNARNRIFQIKIDECIVFQRLTDQEQVILDVINYIDKS